MYDPDETYVYNIKHGTEYPYNSFPKGLHGKIYKKTRFINWQPVPEDIIVRYMGSQVIVNFGALFPNDVVDPSVQVFMLRAKRIELQNTICEQINFFTALYDDDNDLLTSMLMAKCVTDSQTYTLETFGEFYRKLYEILFPPRTLDKIRKMVDENDVGDDIVGLFPLDCLRDIYIVSFMIKVMHIYIEHFIISTGNTPKFLYEKFAEAFAYMMDQINPNMYVLLYLYVSKNILNTVSTNANIFDMQAIDGVTVPTTTQFVMRKVLLGDGLIKLTFASDWDKLNKRPTYSCVGLVKAVINQAAYITRKAQLRFSLVSCDDPSQLMNDVLSTTSNISMIRSFNPGEFCCMSKDLNIIIAQIALEIDLSPLDFYLENLTMMNDLSKILIDTVLYNKFHSSISTNTLSKKQRYILLLYVRHMIIQEYGLSEEDTKTNNLINILMARPVSTSTKTLSQKDMNSIKKYVKLNNLKEYLLSEKNVSIFIENIMQCVMSSYTIVNHNDPDMLGDALVYDSDTMITALLDMTVRLFETL